MNMEQSGAHRSLIARTAFLCAPYFVVLTACAMAASDNIASAAAVLRRLASGDEATLRAALAYMGRTPFQRLRRAVGRTETPLPSDDEGGSGPAGAKGSSSPFRLDPAENVTKSSAMLRPMGFAPGVGCSLPCEPLALLGGWSGPPPGCSASGEGPRCP